MKTISKLLARTSRGIPFALARFNDGEMMAMKDTKGTVARGDQPCSCRLKYALMQALAAEGDNLFIGMPCGTCYPRLRQVAAKAVYVPPRQRTLAVVQTNRNLHRFKTEMPIALIGRRVVWVSGGDQDVSKLPFPVAQHIKVATKDAFSANKGDLYDHEFDDGDVVFLSCGPLATVAAVHLFDHQPFCTFIDIGSTWDPETRGVSHSCHTGTLKPCKECN